jgi:hypothetical protein
VEFDSNTDSAFYDLDTLSHAQALSPLNYYLPFRSLVANNQICRRFQMESYFSIMCSENCLRALRCYFFFIGKMRVKPSNFIIIHKYPYLSFELPYRECCILPLDQKLVHLRCNFWWFKIQQNLWSISDCLFWRDLKKENKAMSQKNNKLVW